MDLIGEFHKVEIDGKPFLVYQNVMKPIPHIHTPISRKAIDSQPLFLCPISRIKKLIDSLDNNSEPGTYIKFETSPLFDDTSDGHHVLPLFWCNNKEVDPKVRECYGCSLKAIGTDYYFCVECDERFHKECVESPLEISHPSHLNHSLQLCFSSLTKRCIDCKSLATYYFPRPIAITYFCGLCDSHMHVFCAQAKIPLYIDKPKRHAHTLSLFPRHPFLHCNICGLINKLYLTYVCPSICDFVAHSDCLNIPQTIKISRHPYHRVSFTSSLPLGNWSCGVCRREINRYYGSYTCNVCDGYAVHTRCALRKDICDGIELEGVPEVEDVVEPPFERISDGKILHFSHGCNLTLENNNGVYDDEKFCRACVLPIYEKKFYVCVKCDFILHEKCAEASRKKVHPLHPHPLELKIVHKGEFECYACERKSSGFGYSCTKQGCNYMLDAVCASVSEPFNYQGHQQHPLFLALDPNEEKPICHICKSRGYWKALLNCIECDFILCYMCATLPYKVRYKHDEHYLTFCRGDEASGLDWCELCEGKLAIGGEKGFYQCNDCCTTLHIECLLGPCPYMKPGLTMLADDGDGWLTHRNSSLSRPICKICNNRCKYPVYVEHRQGTNTTFSCGGCP